MVKVYIVVYMFQYRKESSYEIIGVYTNKEKAKKVLIHHAELKIDDELPVVEMTGNEEIDLDTAVEIFDGSDYWQVINDDDTITILNNSLAFVFQLIEVVLQ